jgi:hypothetical protein
MEGRDSYVSPESGISPNIQRNSDPDAALDATGRRLVWLAGHRGDPDEVIACARRIQKQLLLRVGARLRAECWLLPEYLVAGRAVERAILEGLKRPTTRFSKLFDEELEVAIEYCKLRGILIDRWLLQEGGASLKRQALMGAIVEASLRLPIERRRVLYAWLKDELSVETIAANFCLNAHDVRVILRDVIRAAKPNVNIWLAAWTQPQRPAKRRSRRKKA